MSPSRARYVTACQQLLALGVVVMALVPATRVVTLDVVGERPGGVQAGPTIAVPDAAAYDDAPVTARVTERARDRARQRAEERRAERQARTERSGQRRALHRGDRLQAGLVGARHQDQRAR